MTILAVDPGITTGFARYRPESPLGHRMRVWQVEGLHLAYDGLFEELCWEDDLTVVVERFTIAPKSTNTSQLDPLYVIGAADALCHIYQHKLVLQRPSDAVGPESPFPNRVLQTLGWYQPKTPHGLDAARHLLAFLLRQGGPEAQQIKEAMLG